MRQSKKLVVLNDAPISALQVRARVNRFLLSQVGSQFCAGEPELDVRRKIWTVPILMVTPGFVVGQVGEASVRDHTREPDSHTEIEVIHAAADKLRKRHHAAIKTAFLRARKG